MKFHIITLFPEMFDSWLAESIIGRARTKNLFEIEFYQLRDWSQDKHRRVDDVPYGGGAGMVLTPQPLWDCISHVKTQAAPGTPVIYLTPQGTELTQKIVTEQAQNPELILVCGHYEGIDQRVRDALIDAEISIGQYVLSGGELPAMVLMDALLRFVPGVLGNDDSVAEESFSEKLAGQKEYPHYTRPAEFRGQKVPEVLQSGDHQKIATWRRENCKKP